MEIRPDSDSSVAQARFQEAVNLGKQVVLAERAWANLGRLLSVMEADKDFEALGYHSMGRMLMEFELLTGYSRATAYHCLDLYGKASKHAGVNVTDMRLGSAEIFVTLPENLQRDERIQMAASEAPAKFEEHIRNNFPECHLEKPHVFKFPASRWEVIKGVLDWYRQLEQDDFTDQESLEFILLDYKAIRSQLEEMAVNQE
jgi:hypothetical protein